MNCFAYKTDFLIGKFTAAGHITFSDGTKVNYIKYKRTQLHQGILRCQAAQPHKYIDAVQDQLNYIDNVDMKYVYEDGHEMDKSVRSDVLYNSDNLIISDTWAWRRPHIVMVKSQGATTGINYGYVDFESSRWSSYGVQWVSNAQHVRLI